MNVSSPTGIYTQIVAYLAGNATRANPAKERRRGRLTPGLVTTATTGRRSCLIECLLHRGGGGVQSDR
jgi:hypothetical protein